MPMTIAFGMMRRDMSTTPSSQPPSPLMNRNTLDALCLGTYAVAFFTIGTVSAISSQVFGSWAGAARAAARKAMSGMAACADRRNGIPRDLSKLGHSPSPPPVPTLESRPPPRAIASRSTARVHASSDPV